MKNKILGRTPAGTQNMLDDAATSHKAVVAAGQALIAAVKK